MLKACLCLPYIVNDRRRQRYHARKKITALARSTSEPGSNFWELVKAHRHQQGLTLRKGKMISSLLEDYHDCGRSRDDIDMEEAGWT
jgi:hypothetical protein